MYPITLIRLSKKRKLTVQLFDEKTIVGLLINCDVAMNIHLESAVITSIDGSTVFAKECYLRGSSIKLIKIDHKLMKKQVLFD